MLHLPTELRFNPTLVRLRQANIKAFTEWWRGFNPTLVRLRLLGHPGVWTAILCFNPTLVRLRQLGQREHHLHCVRFQSHAGSIEAVSSAILRVVF